jgi:hypothetical protein
MQPGMPPPRNPWPAGNPRRSAIGLPRFPVYALGAPWARRATLLDVTGVNGRATSVLLTQRTHPPEEIQPAVRSRFRVPKDDEADLIAYFVEEMADHRVLTQTPPAPPHEGDENDLELTIDGG